MMIVMLLMMMMMIFHDDDDDDKNSDVAGQYRCIYNFWLTINHISMFI